MLIDRLEPGSPAVIAWKQFLKDGDRARLLASIPQVKDQVAIGQETNRRWPEDFFLWMAVGLGDWELVDALSQQHGAAIHQSDCPIDNHLFGAMHDFEDAPHVIARLLDHGARIDDRGMNDDTPLHLACRLGLPRVVELLVERGANVNDKTRIDGGYTPLMEACSGGHKEIVEYLLSHGADPAIQNVFGVGTARNFAVQSGHREIAELLDAWCDPAADYKRKKRIWQDKRRKG